MSPPKILYELSALIPRDPFCLFLAIVLISFQFFFSFGVGTNFHTGIFNLPFQNLLVQAKIAAKRGLLVTLGIEPTFPATGYGYIAAGEKVRDF